VRRAAPESSEVGEEATVAGEPVEGPFRRRGTTAATRDGWPANEETTTEEAEKDNGRYLSRGKM